MYVCISVVARKFQRKSTTIKTVHILIPTEKMILISILIVVDFLKIFLATTKIQMCNVAENLTRFSEYDIVFQEIGF